MIQGETHTFPLPDLIQWLALTRRTGMLVIAQGADSVERYFANREQTAGLRQTQRVSVQLYFVEGEVAAASMSELAVSNSADKVRHMLSAALAWHSGRFAFSANPLPAWVMAGNLRLSAETLLVEATAQLSRSQKPTADPPGLDKLAEAKGYSEIFTLADALRFRVVDQMLKEDFSVPAMPQLAVRVLELTRDENFSPRSLDSLILTDQAVTVRVLRYANSALRGGERRAESLSQATQRLGTDEVVNIVLAASLQARRLGHDPFAAEKRRLAVQSSVAAFLARSVAARTGLNGNSGFLCGLLMDFGMNVLYSLIQQVLSQQSRSAPVPRRVVEEIVRDYHPRVGRTVGEKWQLPLAVIEAMAYHHCHDEAPDNPYVALSALSDFLATYVLNLERTTLEESLANFSPELLASHPAARRINLTEKRAAVVLEEVPRNVDQALEFVTD